MAVREVRAPCESFDLLRNCRYAVENGIKQIDEQAFSHRSNSWRQSSAGRLPVWEKSVAPVRSIYISSYELVLEGGEPTRRILLSEYFQLLDGILRSSTHVDSS